MSYERYQSEERPQYRQQTYGGQSGQGAPRPDQQQQRERFEETLTFPVRQAMEFWQNVGEMSMMGFDAAEQFQRQGLELTRSVLESYLRSFEIASSEAQQSVPQQMRVEMQTEGQSSESQQPEYQGQQRQYVGGKRDVGGGRDVGQTGGRTPSGQQSAGQQHQYGGSEQVTSPTRGPPQRQQSQQPTQWQPGQQTGGSRTSQQPTQGQVGQQSPTQGQQSEPSQRGQQQRYGERRREVGPLAPQG